MSLRMALVGMLLDEPKSGYDLTNEFQGSLGEVWSATHGQIYPELARLLDEGLIELDSVGARNRKAYLATNSGRAAVRDWLLQPEPDRTFRNEAFLKTFFLDHLTVSQQRRFLENERSFHQSDLDAYSRLTPSRFGNRAAIRLGIEYKQAMLAWVDWALSEIKTSN